jgi:hypothetical protein
MFDTAGLDNRLIDRGKVVSLTSLPRNIIFFMIPVLISVRSLANSRV